MAKEYRQGELVPHSKDVESAAIVLEAAPVVLRESTGHELIKLHPDFRRAIVRYLHQHAARLAAEEG